MRSALVLVLVTLLAACASQNGQKQAASPQPASSAKHGPAFEVVRVDDSIDPLDAIPDADIPVGSGIAIFQEASLAGSERVVKTHFARVVFQHGESRETACVRFTQWAQGACSLPPDHRWGCEDISDVDPDAGTLSVVGLRTYLLVGEPIITERDVVDAYVGDDKSQEVDLLDVAVKLSPEGRAKLKAATGSWTHRRLAVMADGWINSGPLLKDRIDTDTLTIGFGPRSPAEVDKARAFVSRLLGK